MKTRTSVLLVMVLLALPAFAQDVQLFDGTGQAMVPADVGGALTMYSVLYDGSPAVDTPIPLDFANYEYTMVVTDLIFDSETMFGGVYVNGLIAIYEDDGTAADFADPSTFTDGMAILTGSIGELTRSVYPTGIGSASSNTLDWTGGTRLDDMAVEDQSNWGFFSGINTEEGVLDGYDEVWDCKAEPEDNIVDVEHINWGSLKAEY